MSQYVSNVRTVEFLEVGVKEVVRIKHPPNSRSLKHNHGRSYGFTVVVSGEVYEICYDLTETPMEVIHRQGEWFMETPGTIHVVGSVQGAETLHFYFPPITGTMTTYDEDE